MVQFDCAIGDNSIHDFLDCIVFIQYGPVRNWIYDVDGTINKKLM
jgi:hypothetical protein